MMIEQAIADRLATQQHRIHQAKARQQSRLIGSEGGLLMMRALSAPLGSLVRIAQQDGRSLKGQIIGFRDDVALIAPWQAIGAVAPGAAVDILQQADALPDADQLLGRVIDGLGQCWRSGQRIHAAQKPMDAAQSWIAGRVHEPLDVGVRAINALTTIGRGQRVALMAGSGVGKSVLMGQMMAGCTASRIVVGLIGERRREIADFIDHHFTPEVRRKCVIIAVSADEPPMLRLRAADMTMHIAEQFRDEGQDVLVLMDSLARVAHAQRELGISLGEPPIARGYPPSALALMARLIERAGVDVLTGGAITALFTVLADGDDMNDPIVDAVRGVVDGHIVLSRELAERGIFPAIDPQRSLSRVMADITTSAHRRAAARFRRLWSKYMDGRDLITIGAWREGHDLLLDEAIAGHDQQVDFLMQDQHDSACLSDSIDRLCATWQADDWNHAP